MRKNVRHKFTEYWIFCVKKKWKFSPTVCWYWWADSFSVGSYCWYSYKDSNQIIVIPNSYQIHNLPYPKGKKFVRQRQPYCWLLIFAEHYMIKYPTVCRCLWADSFAVGLYCWSSYKDNNQIIYTTSHIQRVRNLSARGSHIVIYKYLLIIMWSNIPLCAAVCEQTSPQ